MSTGKEPWVGTRILIIRGHYKGQYGHVRGVDVTWETQNLASDKLVVGKTVGRRRGIQLKIDLQTYRAAQSGLLVIDYAHVVDAARRNYLNKVYPVRQGDFYDYRPGLRDPRATDRDISALLDELEATPLVVPSTPQWSPEEMQERIGTGDAWDPTARSPNHIPESPPPHDQPLSSLDPSEEAASDAFAAFVMEAQKEAEAEEAAVPPHWITHPNLVGLSVQATIYTSKTEYLVVVRAPSGDIVPHRKLTKTKTAPITDLDSIQMSLDPIKPSTEKNLMVVVGGSPEHIGKLSRRVSSFYLREKRPENQRIVVGVISRDSDTGKEHLTGERLELDPRYDLARVYESDEARVQSGTYMRAARDAALERTGRKIEIRH
ncbi:hypothetical protein V5O48_015263 [Marasmius crinis-equi]|uniref:KOW domain-containing protein n=1 Tax=Marasmius crinis-equi TaxID=585013 RepID=A0ABR3EV13_9AGAR